MEMSRSAALVVLLGCFCLGHSEKASNVLVDFITSPISSGPSRELRLSELDHFVNTEEGRATLTEEFNSIKGGKRRPWTVAELPENIDKNRYKELLAYDDTRVKLNVKGQSSDYINANYINGTNRAKEYIATQGPLNTTANDFWAMVWQEKVVKLVVLANLVEKGEEKVFKYWPETAGTYGEIVVKKISEDSMPDIEHVVRVFALIKGMEVRVVRQYHFTGWPDLGVPKDRMSVVSLLRQARSYRPESTSPILVHCSAGIGRTGTVILMDSMMERVKKEGVVNFPLRLDSMRVQRVDVVEKPEQYVFAHHAVYDAFTPAASDFLAEVDAAHQAVTSDATVLLQDDARIENVVRKLSQCNYEMAVLLEALEESLKNNKD